MPISKPDPKPCFVSFIKILFHQKNISKTSSIPMRFLCSFLRFSLLNPTTESPFEYWQMRMEMVKKKLMKIENVEERRSEKWILPLIFCFNPPREDDRCNVGIQLELPPKSQPFENLETLDDSLAFQMLGILEVKCLELLPFRFPSPKLWIFGIPGIPDTRNSCQNYSQTNRAYSFFHLTVL